MSSDNDSFDAIVEQAERYAAENDPHVPDAVIVRLSSLAVHVEACQGVVILSMAPHVAEAIRDYLTDALAGGPTPSGPGGYVTH